MMGGVHRLFAGLVMALLLGASWLPGFEAGQEIPEEPEDGGATIHRDRLPPRARMRLGSKSALSPGPVSSIAFSQDGRTLVSGTDDGSIHTWRVGTGTERWRVRGIQGSIHSVACARDGTVLASAGEDGTIRLRDGMTGRGLHVIRGRGGPIRSIAFSPDGKTIASGDDSGRIRISSVETGRRLRSFLGDKEGIRLVTLSPDGTRLAWVGESGDARVWELETGEEILRPDRDERMLYAVAFSPDGERLACAGGEGPIGIFDLATGREQSRLASDDHWVDCLAFSPDGKTLAAGGFFDQVRIWDLEGCREVRRIEHGETEVNAIAFSPDGRTLGLALQDGTISLRDASTGVERVKCPFRMAGIRAVTFSPDGKLLASGGREQMIRLWDPSTGEEVRRLTGALEWVNSLAFSPDSASLASADIDQGVHLWDPGTGEHRFELLPANREPEGSMEGNQSGVAYSPEGTSVAAWLGTRVLRLWRIDEGDARPIWKVVVVSSPPDERGRTHWGTTIRPNTIAFFPEGELLVSLADWNDRQAVRIAAAGTGRELFRMRGPEGAVRALSLSPDGGLLATGEGTGRVLVWEVATGLEAMQIDAHTESVSSLAFSPDGRALATGGMDDSARLWDMLSGKKILDLSGHGRDVTSVAFSPDGRTLATGSLDGTILLWDLDPLDLEPETAPDAPAAEALNDLWAALGEKDPRKAYDGMRVLAAAPEACVAFLEGRLARAPEGDLDRLRDLISDLDDDDFQVRQRAHRRLADLGDRVRGPLLDVLEDDPSPELKARAEALLDAMGPITKVFPSEVLRRRRSIRILEWIGTAGALGVIESLAKGSPSARERAETRAALERLSPRRERKR